AEVGAGSHGGRIEVEYRDLVVAALDDVAAHGAAHVADADESDFHDVLPQEMRRQTIRQNSLPSVSPRNAARQYGPKTGSCPADGAQQIASDSPSATDALAGQHADRRR